MKKEKNLTEIIKRKIVAYRESNEDLSEIEKGILKRLNTFLTPPRKTGLWINTVNKQGEIDKILAKCRKKNINHIYDELQTIVEDTNIEMKKECEDIESLKSLYTSIEAKAKLYPYDFTIQHGLVANLKISQLNTLMEDQYKTHHHRTVDYIRCEEALETLKKLPKKPSSP